MTRKVQSAVALIGAVLAGGGVIVCVAWLAYANAEARSHAQLDASRIELLQTLTQTDAVFAKQLADEQARQTEAQKQRRDTADRLSIALALVAALFVTCVKWGFVLRGKVVLPQQKLVRLGLPAPPHKQRNGKPQFRPRELAEPSPAVLDNIIRTHGATREAALPILQTLQLQFGFLPPNLLRRVCDQTEITPAQLSGVATFYKRFRHTPVGRHFVQVCHGTACHVAGATHITQEIRRQFEIPVDDDTDPQRRVTVEPVACLGCCSLAPVMTIDERAAGRLTPSAACAALRDAAAEESAA